TYRQNNQILYSKAAQYGGRLVVADWAGYSASRSDWVTRDGIHLTPSGATAMAAFIAAQARAQMGQPLELRAAVAPATGVGSDQVLLMWERPLFSNGRVVTDYRVQYAVGRDGPWVTISDHVSAQRWLLVFGLTNGQVYRF